VSLGSGTDNVDGAKKMLTDMHALPYDPTSGVFAQIAHNANDAK